MLCRLYDWTLRLVGHPRAELALGGATFAESSFFSIPPDALLVPMALANRAKAWRYATICVISSVPGSIADYFISLPLSESVAMSILTFYGLLENFEQVAERYNGLGWLMVLLGGGFTLLSYKVIAITSGVTQLDLQLSVGLSLVARSLCFAATCALPSWVGPRLKTLIERHLGMAFVLMAVMMVGGLMLGKYVL